MLRLCRGGVAIAAGNGATDRQNPCNPEDKRSHSAQFLHPPTDSLVQYASVPAVSTPPGHFPLNRSGCCRCRRRSSGRSRRSSRAGGGIIRGSRCPWSARLTGGSRGSGHWDRFRGSRRPWSARSARGCRRRRRIVVGARRRIVVARDQNQRRSRKDECIEYIRLHDIPSDRFCGANARGFHAPRRTVENARNQKRLNE